MTPKTLTTEGLAGLVAELAATGTTVIAPARARDGAIDFKPVKQLADAALDGPLPRLPMKALFFPPTEALFAWRRKKDGVEVDEVNTVFPPRLVLGSRPCDAAAVAALDRVMGWDYKDELWFGRREATTIATVACAGLDDACFCTATGVGPDSSKGSDLLLVPVAGGYHVEVVTPKGEALVAANGRHFRDANGASEADRFRHDARRKVELTHDLDVAAVRRWVEGHFEHPLWAEVATRCHGCGACASVCPTCHCFDIVDEPDGLLAGTRRRNWDTCQTPVFTVHASGHNPRADQGARYRQRVNHKFAIYPARFGELLCTGCGRCSRACPGGMDLPEVLGRIAKMAG
jgi:ferredoxin